MSKDDNLYNAAIADNAFNAYDKAFIAKDLFLTVVPSLLSSAATLAVIFLPLTEFQQGAVVALNAPAGYYTFKRNSPLEKIVKDKQ